MPNSVGILPAFLFWTKRTTMFRLTLFHFFLVFVGLMPTHAQKHDYMWALGFGPNKSEFRFFYRFDTDTPSIELRTDTFSTGQYTSSFCDKKGGLLFFSNGHSIFNKHGAIIENGEGLNPTVLEWSASVMYSYPAGQSSFFLEKPDDPNIVYFISLDFGPHPAQKWPYMFTGQNLLVATIDITANNGAGKVLEKNRVLLTGGLMSPAACRHANGRDWWIMVSDADENRHYRLLLSPEGFSVPETQHIGTKPNPIPYEGGNKSNQIVGNCFSSRGNYYADINDLLGFSVYRFDRCSGLLFYEKRVDLPPSASSSKYYPYGSGTGAVFSDDERFFYRTTTNPGLPYVFQIAGTRPYLFQYDLMAGELAASIDTINVLDSVDYHYPYNITSKKFLGAELGPDGRIYIVHSGLGYSTVQYPNLKGKACKLVHDKPFFDVVIGSAIPYMPNYRLGPLDGSTCDTLGLNNIPVAHFRVDDSLGILSRYFYDLSHHEPATWHWDFGDGSSSNEQSPLHTYDSAGVYQVCLTVSNPYGSDTHCHTLYLGVSTVGEQKLKNQIIVWPNPFSQRLIVSMSANLRSPMFLLYDAMGRLVGKEPIALEVNEIQMKDLNNGMYFWEIISNRERVKSGKLIKVKN